MKKLSNSITSILFIPLILVFSYAYPRAVINAFGVDNPWTSYLYMYGFGIATFLIGLIIIIKAGACNLQRAKDLFWFKFLIFGMIFFASLHAGWIYLALSIPFKGAL